MSSLSTAVDVYYRQPYSSYYDHEYTNSFYTTVCLAGGNCLVKDGAEHYDTACNKYPLAESKCSWEPGFTYSVDVTFNVAGLDCAS